MTVILFLAVLFVLVLVHELGHFVVAKWSKMKVEEFAIGFPPRLFGFRKGDTEYSINLLPIGGYVKILGENGDLEIEKEDRAKSFSARPRYLQAAVLVAGVAMNILTAWLIFFGVGIYGQPTLVEEGSNDEAKLTIVQVAPNSPAFDAKLPIGANILSVESEGEKLDTLSPSQFTSFVKEHDSSKIKVTYNDVGVEQSVELQPVTGIIATEPDRKAVGLSTAMVAHVSETAVEAVKSATIRTKEALVAITTGVFTLIGSAFTFSANLSEVTGPIGIAGMVGDAAEFGFVSLLLFTAFISLNLAVINLLPIPALDGGRLLFVLIEAVIRRPINPEWMTRTNLVGFSLLIILMIAVTYNDIARLL